MEGISLLWSMKNSTEILNELKDKGFQTSSSSPLPPTPNWSPYIFTLVQKVKIVS